MPVPLSRTVTRNLRGEYLISTSIFLAWEWRKELRSASRVIRKICCRTPGSTGFGHPIFAIRRRGAVGGREFILKIGERLLEACGRGIVAAKSLQGGAAFIDSLPHEVADTAQERLRWRIGWEPALGDLELHGGAEESLQQGVVEFACDASSFEAALFLKKNVFPGGFMRIGQSEISRDSPGQWRNTCSFVCHDRSSMVG